MLKCASFFAGVGGIDSGFEQTKYFKTTYANEFDPYPIKTYEKNFKLKVDNRDIHEVKADDIPDFDVMIAGFPCQAFSVAGKQQGFNDDKGRGTLFFELIRIIQAKQPKIVFLENVKNLVAHDHGKTFKVIINTLKAENYFVKYQVMNALEYGNIPQNRERIYIVCFKNKQEYENFEFPKPISLTTSLNDIIDFNKQVAEKYYYTAGKYQGDIYEKLQTTMTSSDYIYQWRRNHVRKCAKKGIMFTLTANQGGGGHNVFLVKTKYGIRKMTPHECFLAQGFDKSFKLPTDLSDTRLYKQAGNSVCVPVIRRIAEQIKIAIKKVKITKE